MNFNQNEYGNFNKYPNLNQNIYQSSGQYGMCNMCKGSGSYIMNGVNVPCQCSERMNNFNMNPYNPPQEMIYNKQNYHPHHKNIFSRTLSAISDCVSCAGHGFVDIFTKSGHPKVCYDCIRESGYCPVCQNTGYKVHSGKRCKCGIY